MSLPTTVARRVNPYSEILFLGLMQRVVGCIKSFSVHISMLSESGTHHGEGKSRAVSQRNFTRRALMISQGSRSDASPSSPSVNGPSAVFDPRDSLST